MKHKQTHWGCLWCSAVTVLFLSVLCFDCVEFNGLHVLYGTPLVHNQSDVIGCPAFCCVKGFKAHYIYNIYNIYLLLALGQCFWYSLLLWNQPEIFLEHFDTILSSRCLVYISVYTMMECSSYCGSNHRFLLQDLTEQKCDNYLSYLTEQRINRLCSVLGIITLCL